MPIDPLFSSLQISASGLAANRRWMDAIAENLANAQTTRTEEGGPYRRKIATFEEVSEKVQAAKSPVERKLDLNITHKAHMRENFGSKRELQVGTVRTELERDGSDFTWVYDPGHPDANEEGYVAYPNVEVVREMVDLITASRAYEANVTAMNAVKAMHKKAIDI